MPIHFGDALHLRVPQSLLSLQCLLQQLRSTWLQPQRWLALGREELLLAKMVCTGRTAKEVGIGGSQFLVGTYCF